MFRRGCVCGHMWAAHNHYGGQGGCCLCPCDRYRPRPRRWWRRSARYDTVPASKPPMTSLPPAGGEPPASPRSGERSPLPGQRLVSHERLPGGYTRNLCACRCWSLADDRSRVIFRYVCGTCTRADLDQFLEETLADPP